MTEPIVCPHCGYENIQHHSICHKCGKKLDTQPSEGTKAELHKMSNRPQEVIVKEALHKKSCLTKKSEF